MTLAPNHEVPECVVIEPHVAREMLARLKTKVGLDFAVSPEKTYLHVRKGGCYFTIRQTADGKWIAAGTDGNAKIVSKVCDYPDEALHFFLVSIGALVTALQVKSPYRATGNGEAPTDAVAGRMKLIELE